MVTVLEVVRFCFSLPHLLVGFCLVLFCFLVCLVSVDVAYPVFTFVSEETVSYAVVDFCLSIEEAESGIFVFHHLETEPGLLIKFESYRKFSY